MENIAGRIDLFQNIYLVCLGAMILCLLVAIILFFKLNIVGVIGFFTGKQAKKEISKIQDSGFEKKSGKVKVTPEIKKELGLHKTNEVSIRKVEDIPIITVTKKLEDGSEELTSILIECDEDATTVLSQETAEFYVEREILLIHTNEIIE